MAKKTKPDGGATGEIFRAWGAEAGKDYGRVSRRDGKEGFSVNKTWGLWGLGVLSALSLTACGDGMTRPNGDGTATGHTDSYAYSRNDNSVTTPRNDNGSTAWDNGSTAWDDGATVRDGATEFGDTASRWKNSAGGGTDAVGDALQNP